MHNQIRQFAGIPPFWYRPLIYGQTKVRVFDDPRV